MESIIPTVFLMQLCCTSRKTLVQLVALVTSEREFHVDLPKQVHMYFLCIFLHHSRLWMWFTQSKYGCIHKNVWDPRISDVLDCMHCILLLKNPTLIPNKIPGQRFLLLFAFICEKTYWSPHYLTKQDLPLRARWPTGLLAIWLKIPPRLWSSCLI